MASERLKKYFISFSKNTRQRLKINLTNTEIYLTLETAFRRFRIKLYKTRTRDAEITHDYFIPTGHGDSKSVRIFFK